MSNFRRVAKFIVDAHLPKKFSNYLKNKGFDAIHTLDLPKGNATSDDDIVKLSIKEKRIVISKDSDFYNRFLVKVEPHKLIIISTGNISTKRLMELIDKNFEKIIDEIRYNFVVEITQNSLITIL